MRQYKWRGEVAIVEAQQATSNDRYFVTRQVGQHAVWVQCSCRRRHAGCLTAWLKSSCQTPKADLTMSFWPHCTPRTSKLPIFRVRFARNCSVLRQARTSCSVRSHSVIMACRITSISNSSCNPAWTEFWHQGILHVWLFCWYVGFTPAG